MRYETIIFEEHQGLFRITLNRPDKLNSFNDQMKEEFFHALTSVEVSSPRVLLISGSGRGFCAGQDLSERDEKNKNLDLGFGPDTFYNPLVRRLAALPAPVVCAVNGTAAGAGVNLALACDIVVARKSAKFVQAFSDIGLVPDAGGTWNLPRLIGQSRALGFTLLGDRITAKKAERIGLIWKAIKDEKFEMEVESILEKLANAPTFSLGSSKTLIRSAWCSTLDQALDRERDTQRNCGLTDDYREGVAAFKKKRKPNFSGH